MKRMFTLIIILSFITGSVPFLHAREESVRNLEDYYRQEINSMMKNMGYYTDRLKNAGIKFKKKEGDKTIDLLEEIKKALKTVEDTTEEKGYKPEQSAKAANSAVAALGSFDDSNTPADEGSGFKSDIQDQVRKEKEKIWDRTPANEYGTKSSDSWSPSDQRLYNALDGILYYLGEINKMLEKIKELRDEEVKETPKTVPAPVPGEEKKVSFISPEAAWYANIAVVLGPILEPEQAYVGLDYLRTEGFIKVDSLGNITANEGIKYVLEDPARYLPGITPEHIKDLTAIGNAVSTLQDNYNASFSNAINNINIYAAGAVEQPKLLAPRLPEMEILAPIGIEGK